MNTATHFRFVGALERVLAVLAAIFLTACFWLAIADPALIVQGARTPSPSADARRASPPTVFTPTSPRS